MSAAAAEGRDNRPGREPGTSAAWRLFVAVPLPQDVRSALEDALGRVRDEVRGGRWLGPETWHLTLRFLGDTPVPEIPLIEEAVRSAARTARPFAAALGHAGAFERRSGRVAWIGLDSGAEAVAALARALAAATAPDEVSREPFRAHLTIAREAPVALVGALDEAMREARTGRPRPASAGLGSGPPAPPVRLVGGDPFAWTVDRLVLYRSVLGRTGAQHTPLLEARLGEPVG